MAATPAMLPVITKGDNISGNMFSVLGIAALILIVVTVIMMTVAAIMKAAHPESGL